MGRTECGEYMVTLREAADILGVHYQTIRNYARRGLLSTRKFLGDKHVYVTQESIQAVQISSKIKINSIGVLVELHMKVIRLEKKVADLEYHNPGASEMREQLKKLHPGMVT